MKLSAFSVTNYRSITSANKIKLDDLTILLGKNNEGKSNIIKAIAICMDILKREVYRPSRVHRNIKYLDESIYCWERDFPVDLQNRKKGLETIFKLNFELNEKEIEEFKTEIKSNLNGNIEIKIAIGKDNIPKISVPKRGTDKLTKKSKEIRNFIIKKITFNYIKAIRTEDEALDIVRNTLSQELKHLENNEIYIENINKINALQKDILNDIAKKIKNNLKSFIPSIKDVELKIQEDLRRVALRKDIDIIINDGSPTDLAYKGDGIKSLVSLAILVDKYNTDGASIIAIDEPEAHLHPGAIGELNQVIENLKTNNQVIISTHNPLFVNRTNIHSNIIINNSKATIAKSIKEIREILGIKLSDNLANASNILIVEGECDKKIIEKICIAKSDKIKNAISSGSFQIDFIGGLSNLKRKLYELKNIICKYYVFLDGDNPAKQIVTNLQKEDLLKPKDYRLISCLGKKESELEDCYKVETYKNFVYNEYGVDLSSQDFKMLAKDKWSVRMKKIFEKQGKIWDDDLEKEIKIKLSNYLINKNVNDILDDKCTSIKDLINEIERAL